MFTMTSFPREGRQGQRPSDPDSPGPGFSNIPTSFPEHFSLRKITLINASSHFLRCNKKVLGPRGEQKAGSGWPARFPSFAVASS